MCNRVVFNSTVIPGFEIQFFLPFDLEDAMTAGHTTNWPELAIGLYERLTGKNAEIIYALEDMHIKIPSGTGSNAEHAEWVLNGKLKISTKDLAKNPN